MKWKHVKETALFVLVSTVIYFSLALAPYVGSAYVSELTKASFSMEQFYGAHEIPERVMLVEEPEDAFFQRLNLIDHAKDEIFLTTYSIHDGITTDILVGALLSSADRGVDVRLLNNAVSGQMSSDYLEVLSAHEHIDVYFWQPLNLIRPQYFNANLHDKYMIVDETFMLLGGRNIGDKYFDPESADAKFSFDREVLVYNTDVAFSGSIAEVKGYFETKIDSEQVSLHEIKKRSDEWEALHERYVHVYLDYVATIAEETFDYKAQTTGVNQITLLTDPLHETKKESRVAYQLMMMTKHSDVIVAQSPYIALTKPHLDLFAQAVEGKDVTLLTNSLASTANLPAFSAYYADREKIRVAGISIYEFQSTQASIHSKTYLFDGRLTAIGSFNLNERSIRSDTESVLIIDSPAFHDIAQQAIADQMSQSLLVGEGGKYEVNDDVTECPVSLKRHILYLGIGYGLKGLRILF